ncbi:Uncharacterized protein HZ326_13874 [Fusarium oxysporum f. sp. albedinis]|nr:Uncharacterized protein HZ326_13874 [Fusarium oxysporum f. sp. albedinis]
MFRLDLRRKTEGIGNVRLSKRSIILSIKPPYFLRISSLLGLLSIRIPFSISFWLYNPSVLPFCMCLTCKKKTPIGFVISTPAEQQSFIGSIMSVGCLGKGTDRPCSRKEAHPQCCPIVTVKELQHWLGAQIKSGIGYPWLHVNLQWLQFVTNTIFSPSSMVYLPPLSHCDKGP